MRTAFEVREVSCLICGDPMLVVKDSWPDRERLCNRCVLGKPSRDYWREED